MRLKLLGATRVGKTFSVLIIISSLEVLLPAEGNNLSKNGDAPLFEANDNILTPEGEVPVDFPSGNMLPEQLNDGELETGDRHSIWTYADQKNWAGEYPECKGVKLRQSPIDIITNDVTFKPQIKLELIDYNQEVEFELKNTHHSASFTPIPSISTPKVRANWVVGDEKEFELQEIHFHWGDGFNKGSEHEINDQKFAAEMHMVHYRKGVKKSDIGTTENSVLVLGVMIESDAVVHHKLESLVSKTERINGTDLEYIDDNPENLINLLPENHHSFYTYNGSLTTPPCYEVVTWVILNEPVFMAQDKLVELTNLEAMNPIGGRQKIAANHRDIQPLLNRPVYASFNASDLTTNTLQQSSRWLNGKNFQKAFAEYWNLVNNLRTSVRRAFSAIEAARQKLKQRLRGNSAAPAKGETTPDGSNSSTTKP